LKNYHFPDLTRANINTLSGYLQVKKKVSYLNKKECSVQIINEWKL